MKHDVWGTENGVDIISGHISFKNNRKKQVIRTLFKGVAFFTVAALTGGVSGAYISNKKAANTNLNANSFIILPSTQHSNENISDTDFTQKNDITWVAQKVFPSIVGITDKDNSTGIVTKESGIIYSPDGYIVTNYDYIKNDGKITVNLLNNGTLPATIVGHDDKSGIAVIKINAKDLPAAKFADYSKVNIGDWVIALGNRDAKGNTGFLTAGIVNTLNRSFSIEGTSVVEKLIQTSAGVSDENCGGALCNISGEIVGINSLKFLRYNETTSGVGVAFPIDEVSNIIDKIMKSHVKEEIQLGVKGTDVEMKNYSVKGVYVTEVTHGSCAEAAGIKNYDIVIELDKSKIIKYSDITKVIAKHNAGDKISCKVLRNGKTVQLTVALSKGAGT